MKHRTAGLKCPPTPGSSKVPDFREMAEEASKKQLVYETKKLVGTWRHPNGATIKISTTPDFVNHPKHYQSGSGLEVFDVIKAFAPKPNTDHEVFLWGNAVKYLLRYRHKRHMLLDLQKAEVYVRELIKLLEKADHDKRLKNRRTSTVGSLPTVSAKSKVQSVQPRTQSGHFMARKTTDKVVTRGSK